MSELLSLSGRGRAMQGFVWHGLMRLSRQGWVRNGSARYGEAMRGEAGLGVARQGH